MSNEEPYTALCQFMSQPSAKSEFTAGCKQRGLSPSSLYRMAQDDWIGKFRQEDAAEDNDPDVFYRGREDEQKEPA